MSKNRAARRPQHPAKQTPQVKLSKHTQKLSCIRKTKRKTNTSALQKKAKYVQSWLHSSINPQQKTSAARSRTTQKTTIHQLISDEVSSLDNDSPDSDTESVEQINLTHDNIEYRAADEIRGISYDSRCEPGNELYKLDDFVVDDSDESENESVSSEITAMRKVSGCSLRPRPSVVSVARRSSMRSTESGRSALEQVVESAGDVVGEIMDAMAQFKRRCNRTLRRRKFVLATKVLEDEALREVLDDVVRLGLGWLVSSLDETEV